MKGLRLPHMLALVLGLVFLYAPIAVLIVYSFNASKLVTVWGGVSTRWYGALFANEALREAAFLSLRIALVVATLATALGALAAMALARLGRFNGRTLFGVMIAAPLVMPEVVIGVSLLLLFVGLDVERGFWTVVVAHTTLATCFATVVVRARLVSFDASLEEAALDLGATPPRAFMTITLPLIAPAVAAAWMLAFALSLDDLVIASFASGPGAATLPMRLYSAIRLGVTPEINAASTLLIVMVATLVTLASVMVKRDPSRLE